MVETPTLAEQIEWLRDRAHDAALLRDFLVESGSVNVDRAERDAVMWNAVLCSLESIAAREEPNTPARPGRSHGR